MLRRFVVITLLLLTACARVPPRDRPKPPPNVIVILADDLGHGDVGAFGARDIPTPHLDRMAKEGARLTSFYVSQAVCSASRAALLTGAHARRLSVHGAYAPESRQGLHTQERTLAELLKTRGYATAAIGKWHLGHAHEFLPTRRGFDQYFGIPYSNDMGPRPNRHWPSLPLIEGERVVAREPVQAQLTAMFTARALSFIESQRSRPFFLYVAHPMPHVPLAATARFQGRSSRGLYGDVVAELDWSVGEILTAVRRLGLAENTLVIFTSDNGPWLQMGDHGGSPAPFREGKMTTFEGGVRVPGIFWWPGRIPAGLTSDEIAATVDLLPTIASLAGAQVPPSPRIDGHSLWDLLTRPGAPSPHEAYPYYWQGELRAVRSGRWKLQFPHRYTTPDTAQAAESGRRRMMTGSAEKALFDLNADREERSDVSSTHPEVVQLLESFAARFRADLGDTLASTRGAGVRPAGEARDPTPSIVF